MTADDVVEAFHAIEAAQERYRTLLREARKDRGVQAELVIRLGRSREQLRQDAMTDEERAAVREADAERKRQLRERAKD